MNEELLAQLVEEVSVQTSQRQRKDPRSIPRPWEKEPETPASGVTVAENGGVTASGLTGMLSVTQRRGAVNLGG